MIALDLDPQQVRAIQAPLESCIAILGAAGTGKSAALHARIARASAALPSARPLVFPRQHQFDRLALDVLAGTEPEVRLVDDIDAAALFATACAPLFSLEWAEFESQVLDPDVPGLRTPERFFESAFRLIRKLRDARIGPSEFLASSLQGATAFYAKPPNLADPQLLYATKDAYHDSLAVNASELQRQHRREVDLAKILAKLYEGYVERTVTQGLMTGRDAIDVAVDRLHERPDIAAHLRDTHGLAFVDDAETMTPGELQLLQAIFGATLAGVTFCGDPGSSIETFRAARPEAAFACATERFELAYQFRSPLTIERACRKLTGATPIPASPVQNAQSEPELMLHRAQSQREEAAFVAERVRAWLDEGTPPGRIAVLFRSVRTIEAYESALLDRGVPIAVAGDANPFADRRALDAIALLWNVYDPFRHDWLLRTLGNGALALSDASLAALCAEPPNPQTPLFVHYDEPAPTARSSRWDPKRDLRLGWNVVRGEQDAALSPDARDRIEGFRAARLRWIGAMNTLPFAQFVPSVWNEGLAIEGAPGSARARAQRTILAQLLSRLTAFLDEHPDAIIADVLAYAERRGKSDLESCAPPPDCDDCVQVRSIEASRGETFDRVAIPNVRAGAFPRWYVPDTFLYSPRLGMVPKDNAGDARAARTAKFSYYMFRVKAREGYNAQERRAIVYALRRARHSALVTSSNVPTKGLTAPEFFEELRNARLSGAVVV